MNVIGIDSSTNNLNIGIISKNNSFEYSFDYFRGHAEMIDEAFGSVLKKAGLNIDNIDLFVVTNGPGSYTGLRVSSAFTKGLLFGKDKKFVSISTVYAMSFHYKDSKENIAIVYDIRHDKIVFMDNRNFNERILSISDLSEIDWCNYKVTGNGIDLLEKEGILIDENILKDGIAGPSGLDVVRSGLKVYKENGAQDLIMYEPRYFK
ncbi:tRNA (adenosine(37)-N6)-threonylcarbamoyltransferase complex dimerization subunit type 1 TsaB [candidate division TA06 bacterium]|uniref:tRNA (Adenosine(37)-N6)-threonylcarbamoyltransferase complex dimerization subunit type 1 TsaB n=1 Tax=candidate division TA06 bacterium TaxID=2250710 RepID=A0A660SK45_UNCT6|nr:MAG: tRNA (adenosine(37)-N6)-threonylcarbamoyltransferase complex dimerization subunit type 1 TsaB [candidate division TA06 bacterium]